MRQLKDGTLRGPCAALTFDDGDISLQRHVSPLLEKHRIPATFFINSGYWGARRTYWVYLFGYLAHNEDESKRAVLSGELKSQFGVLRNTTDPMRYQELRERIEAFSDLVDPGEQLFVPKAFLASLDPELFSVALHGHEHQRFSMMPEAWQRQCLESNVAELSDLPAYCPIFGVPFGRPHDWDDRVIRICREMGLDVAFANGGINWPGRGFCERMPADGSKALAVFRGNLVGW
jgi:peptidoglycan/xylan/chitin deacetylase (PgdA/CDA1 family)